MAVTSSAERPRVPGVSLRRVITSEWIKLRSVRSTVITLIASVVLLVGVGVGTSAAVAGLEEVAGDMAAGDWNPGDPFVPADPTEVVLGGVRYAQLLIGALGVLFVSSEYSSGMIRATLASVPARLSVLWAKSIVLAAVSFVLMLVASLVAFFGGGWFLASANVAPSLSDPDVLRAVLAAPVYLAGVGLLGIALATLIRSTAAAIATLYAVTFLVPPLLGLVLPSDVGYTLASYMPSSGGQAFMSVTLRPWMLSPWMGFGVFCGYIGAMLGVAAVVLNRRDA